MHNFIVPTLCVGMQMATLRRRGPLLEQLVWCIYGYEITAVAHLTSMARAARPTLAAVQLSHPARMLWSPSFSLEARTAGPGRDVGSRCTSGAAGHPN